MRQCNARINRNGQTSIDLETFQRYLLFCPHTDTGGMSQVFRHIISFDIGEDALVPVDFSAREKAIGLVWRHLLAGGVAGAISRTCTAPLDRLKVFLQVHANSTNRMTVRTALSLMYQEGGIKSFWRGNGVNVIKIAPETAIKFMSYEQAKRFIHGDNPAEITA